MAWMVRMGSRRHGRTHWERGGNPAGTLPTASVALAGTNLQFDFSLPPNEDEDEDEDGMGPGNGENWGKEKPGNEWRWRH